MVPFQTDRPCDSAMIGAGVSTDLGSGSLSDTILVNGSGSSTDALLPRMAAVKPVEKSSMMEIGWTPVKRAHAPSSEGSRSKGISADSRRKRRPERNSSDGEFHKRTIPRACTSGSLATSTAGNARWKPRNDCHKIDSECHGRADG